jgi:hypothetical protein
MTSLPPEVVSHNNIFRPFHSHMDKYLICIKHLHDRANYSLNRYNDIDSCKTPLKHACPRFFSGSSSRGLNRCYSGIIKLNGSITDLSNGQSVWASGNSQKDLNFNHYPSTFDRLIQAHARCLSEYTRRHKSCAQFLHETCDKAKAKVVKVIRVTMETVRYILEVSSDMVA